MPGTPDKVKEHHHTRPQQLCPMYMEATVFSKAGLATAKTIQIMSLTTA